MPTIVYCCSEPVMCEISMEEFMRRESMPQIIAEETGRMARRYIREYDEIHEEMLGEKDARRAKYMRNHKSRCKEKMQSLRYRNRAGIAKEKIPDNCHFRGHDADRGYWRNWKAYCEMKSIPEWKAEDRERSLRHDFDIEQINIADAMALYADYCLMVEQHEERLWDLNSLPGSVEFWQMMIDNVSREKIYEENRIREMRSIADSIMKGECY